MRNLLFIPLFFLSACQLPDKKPAVVKNIELDNKINPKHKNESVIQTLPLMNNGVKNLYNQAKKHFQLNAYDQAIVSLERAYEIQPKAPQISQLLSEILLHKGNNKQAHYWASISTKNSPAKGEICEKSWRILAIAAQQLGYDANQAMALDKQEQCLVKSENRY